MVAGKRMGLRWGAQVDKYLLFNRLVYMALNNAQSEYLNSLYYWLDLTSLDRS